MIQSQNFQAYAYTLACTILEDSDGGLDVGESL